MSSRANARLYSGGGNIPRGSLNPTGVPLIPALFGQANLSGGMTAGPDGTLQYTPYQGSSGFFGGWSRNRAAELNAQVGGPILQTQAESKAAMEQQKLAAQIAEHLMNSKQIADMMSKSGVPLSAQPEKLKQLADELASNSIQQTQNVGRSLKRPEQQEATDKQLIAEAQAQDAQNRQRLQMTAGPNSITTQPGPLGQGNAVARGSISQTSTTLGGGYPIDPKNPNSPRIGQFPMTQQTNTEQGFTPPVDPRIIEAAKAQSFGQPQGPPMPQAALPIPSPQQPSVTNDAPSRAAMLSTGITPGGPTITPGYGFANPPTQGPPAPAQGQQLTSPDQTQSQIDQGGWNPDLINFLKTLLSNGGNIRQLSGPNAGNLITQ